LDGGTGARVFKLITLFGGGNSHTLAALYRAANRREALNVVPEGEDLPKALGGDPPRMGIHVAEVVEGFYSLPEFPRITCREVARKAIARGVGEREFGHCSASVPAVVGAGKYEVALAKVRAIAPGRLKTVAT